MATRVLFCAITCDNPRCDKLELFGAEAKLPYQRCSACRSLYYCGAACQREHRATHRPDCSATAEHGAIGVSYSGQIAAELGGAAPAPASGLHYERSAGDVAPALAPAGSGLHVEWGRAGRTAWSELLQAIAYAAADKRSSAADRAMMCKYRVALIRIGDKHREIGGPDAVVRRFRGLFVACAPEASDAARRGA